MRIILFEIKTNNEDRWWIGVLGMETEIFERFLFYADSSANMDFFFCRFRGW